MKIGIDISALTSRATGTSRYISSLIEQAVSSGREIITFGPDASLSKFFSSLPEVFSPVKHGGLRKHLYRNFFLRKEMMNAGIDCGIFPDYFLPPSFTKPSAVIIHDLSFISHPWFYSPAFIKFYRHELNKTLKLNPVIVTISEHSRNQINQYLSIPKEKIFLLQGYCRQIKKTIIKNGFDEKPYFLFVGHVEPRKNLNFMVENFIKWNTLRKAGFRLKIVGELWIKSHGINSMISRYKNHPDVEFTGYVDEERLHEYYLHASAFVHTSFVEGFGMPVLEAMHYGLPVLCTAGSATEEISKPYSVTVDPRNSISLVDGFDAITEKISNSSIYKYQIKYSPETMQKQLNNLLEVLERKVKGPHYPVIKRSAGAEEAVEKTLLYAKLFNTGVKKEDLHSRLFDIQLSEAGLEKAVCTLQEKKRIIPEKGILYLNTRIKSAYNGNINKSREKKKSMKLLKLLKKVPFISMISFSGGTAHYGFENHNDVDLFIITKPDTIYISYFIIHLLSLLFNARKELCANYLIDESGLEIKDQTDFYTAHQIITLIPFKNKAILNQFWKKNEWVKEYFPNFAVTDPGNFKQAGFYILCRPLNRLLGNFYRSLYKYRLINSSGSLKLTDNCIKLHTNDYRFITSNEFARAWEEYNAVPGILPSVRPRENYSSLIGIPETANKEVI